MRAADAHERAQERACAFEAQCSTKAARDGRGSWRGACLRVMTRELATEE